MVLEVVRDVEMGGSRRGWSRIRETTRTFFQKIFSFLSIITPLVNFIRKDKQLSFKLSGKDQNNKQKQNETLYDNNSKNVNVLNFLFTIDNRYGHQTEVILNLPYGRTLITVL